MSFRELSHPHDMGPADTGRRRPELYRGKDRCSKRPLESRVGVCVPNTVGFCSCPALAHRGQSSHHCLVASSWECLEGGGSRMRRQLRVWGQMDLSLNPSVLSPKARPLISELHLETGWSPRGPAANPSRASSPRQQGSWGQEQSFGHRAEGIWTMGSR